MKSRIKNGNADPAIIYFPSESGQRVSFYAVYFKQTTLGISCGNEMQKTHALSWVFLVYLHMNLKFIMWRECGTHFFPLYTHSFSHNE